MDKLLRVPIEGVLVNSFDDYMCAGGSAVFCPDAAGYVRYLAEMGEVEALEVSINSEGGDVQGAENLANAIRYFSEKRGAVTVIVEGLAASAAANLLLKVRDCAKLKARLGSQLMFHSCAAAVFGGADAMRDAAEGIDGYNEGIKELLRKYTDIPEERFGEWFQEGRMGWLTAQEAQECGLVEEVIGGTVAELSPIDETAAGRVALWRRGVRVAYIYRGQTQKKEANMAEEIRKDEGAEKVTEEEKEIEIKTDEPKDEGKEEKTVEIEEILEELKNLKERVAACEKERDDAKATVAKLTGGLKAHADSHSTGKKWAELVKEACAGKQGKAWDDAYIALKAKYPEAFKAYTENKTNIHHK